MNFIGHTRFNLYEPSSEAWNLSKATTGEEAGKAYLRELYNPERLDLRCGILLEQSLPQLEKASQGHNLVHIISYSNNLPHEYKERLRAAAERYKFVELDERPVGEGMTVSLDEIARGFMKGDPTNQAMALYRLDDDDVLSLNYFDMASQYVRPEFAGMAVSFGRGISALYVDGQFSGFRWTKYRFNAQGMLFIGKLEDGRLRLPRSGNHEIVDEKTPTIVDSREPGWLWAKHPAQDTRHGVSEADNLGKIIRNLSGSDEVPDDISVTGLFPHARGIERLAEPWESHAVSTSLVPGNGIQVPLDRPWRIFSVSISAKVGADAGVKEILLALDLYDLAGEQISGEDIEIPGLGFNPRKDIGYWRYLKTTGGAQTLREFFLLPEGVECRAVRLKKWANPKCEVFINDVNIRPY